MNFAFWRSNSTGFEQVNSVQMMKYWGLLWYSSSNILAVNTFGNFCRWIAVSSAYRTSSFISRNSILQSVQCLLFIVLMSTEICFLLSDFRILRKKCLELLKCIIEPRFHWYISIDISTTICIITTWTTNENVLLAEKKPTNIYMIYVRFV